jgi:hypothetical protein
MLQRLWHKVILILPIADQMFTHMNRLLRSAHTQIIRKSISWWGPNHSIAKSWNIHLSTFCGACFQFVYAPIPLTWSPRFWGCQISGQLHKPSLDRLVVYLQQLQCLSSHIEPEIPVDPDAEKAFMSDICTNMAWNKAVVVRGWSPQMKMDFAINDFERHGYQLEQEVEQQCDQSIINCICQCCAVQWTFNWFMYLHEQVKVWMWHDLKWMHFHLAEFLFPWATCLNILSMSTKHSWPYVHKLMFLFVNSQHWYVLLVY